MPVKIHAQAVERSFRSADGGRIHALGPIDLDIRLGEFVCIVGPSGCGKSTFLRIVGGLTRPSTGAVAIQTDDPRAITPIVFQDYSIFPWKRVLENVRFGLDIRGVPKSEGNERARHYLERLGLSGWERSYPRVLSGGMKQRVAIARALAVESEILLMDEPFAALDAQLRRIMQEELLSLWQEEQRTVVFITHSLEEAILLGDRVIVMSASPGRLLEDVQIPFERPRAAEIRNSEQFVEMVSYLWDLLRSEVEPDREVSASA